MTAPLDALNELRKKLITPPTKWDQLGEEDAVIIAHYRIINEGYNLEDTAELLGVPYYKLLSALEKKYREYWYEGASKKFIAHLGENNPIANKKVYTFYHPTGAMFAGTTYEFSKKYDIPRRNINRLLSDGPHTSTAGWYKEPITPELVLYYRRQHSSKAGRHAFCQGRDKELYHFYHQEKELSVIATRWGMREYGYLHQSAISTLILGQRFGKKQTQCLTQLGWCLIKNAEVAYLPRKGELSSSYDPTIRHWINLYTGERHDVPTYKMIELYGAKDFRAVARGDSNSTVGWVLNDSAVGDSDAGDRPKKTRTHGVRHRFMSSMKKLNTSLRSNNTTGVCGVNYFKRTGKYTASIGVDGKNIHLGYFSTLEGAIEARKKAEVTYYDPDPEFIPTYIEGTLNEIATIIGLNFRNVSACIKGKLKDIGGSKDTVWIYQGLASNPLPVPRD